MYFTGIIAIFLILCYFLIEYSQGVNYRQRLDKYCRQNPFKCNRLDHRSSASIVYRSKCGDEAIGSSSNDSQKNECNKSSDSYCNPNSVAINNSNPNDKTRTRVIELKHSGQHRQELVFICRRNEIYNVIGNNGTLIVSQQLYRRPIKVVCGGSSGQWFEYNSKKVVIGFYCAMMNSSSSTTTSPSTTTQSHSSHCRKFSNCHSCVNHVGCNYCQSTTLPSCLAVADNSNCSTDDLIKFTYDCAKPPHFEYMYSDSFARTKMFPLAAAAYSTNPAPCLANGSFTLNQQRTVVCDAVGNNCSAFTAISHSDRAIIIAFRGTKYNQLSYEVSATVNTKVSKAFAAGGRVIEYFHDAFFALWINGSIRDDFVMLYKRYPSYELWIVGHSLGGALASLGASLIVHSRHMPGHRIKLVTMGQPRTGDLTFAKTHDRLLPYSYRLIHGFDVIADSPNLDPAYAFHHRYDVWYNNSMVTPDYQLCTRADNDGCNNACPGVNGCLTGNASCPGGNIACLLGSNGCPGVYQCLQQTKTCPQLLTCLQTSSASGFITCFETDTCPQVIDCIEGANGCPNLIPCLFAGANGCPGLIECFSSNDCAMTSLIDHTYYFNQDIANICADE